MILQVQELMGLGQADDGGDQKTFTDDVLKIEICGADQYVVSEFIFPFLDQSLSRDLLGSVYPTLSVFSKARYILSNRQY